MQNTGADNTAASRSGTTDMNSGSTGGAGTSQPGSGLKTKRNVTGSDYDGQA